MADLGDKTPISCLQEYLVSKKMISRYELIHNGTGTHKPEFTYRIQIGALHEDGTGRSKQEAKHRAAEKMLKRLKVIDAKTQAEEEFYVEPTENYIGQLKEICFHLHYPEPKYHLEEAAGPPHCKIFKMICCVSQLQNFGISKTKKQAKHQAAYKMFQHLKQLCGEKIEQVLQSEAYTKPVNLQLMPETDDEVTEKYYSLRTVPATSQRESVVYYKDYYKAYVGLEETSPTLKEILKESHECDLKSSLSLVQLIAEELKVTLKITVIPSKKKNENFTLISMSVFPPIAAIGVDEIKAAFNLLNSLLALCQD